MGKFKINNFLILICLIVFSLFADQWFPAKTEKYYSKNREYYLKVIPGCCIIKKQKSCFGILYKTKKFARDKKIWEIALDNNVAPVDVIVSESGDYIITFDNWHQKGYGDNVIVIYDKKGNLLKKFSLEEVLTKYEISKIPISVSSRWWGTGHFIDEENEVLILRIIDNITMPWNKDAKFKEVKIDLKTFKRLD